MRHLERYLACVALLALDSLLALWLFGGLLLRDITAAKAVLLVLFCAWACLTTNWILRPPRGPASGFPTGPVGGPGADGTPCRCDGPVDSRTPTREHE